MRRVWLVALLIGIAVPVAAQPTLTPEQVAGWGWGPSIGFVSQNIGADLVSPGGVVVGEDGILRIVKDNNSEPMLLFGTHYILGVIGGKVGIGPGIVIRPGDSLIDAAGGGIVFEFKDAGQAAGFSLGVGAIKVFTTSRLATGWEDGALAPPGPIQFREQGEVFLGFWTGVAF